MSDTFYPIYLLMKKYSSWYFLKKAVFFNNTRLATVTVCSVIWIILASLSVFVGYPVLAIILFVITVAAVKRYPQFIKNDYPQYTEKYPDPFGLYERNDDYLKFMSIRDDLEKQGNLTPTMLNQALEDGQRLETIMSINITSKKVFFYGLLILGFIAGSLIHIPLSVNAESVLASLFIGSSVIIFAYRFFSDKDVTIHRQVRMTIFYIKMIQHLSGFDEEKKTIDNKKHSL
jgi:hypothetical protein